jgi:hypothetical protein
MEIEESQKYENSLKVIRKATKEDAESIGVELGTEYTIIPEPKNKEEAIERFKKLIAQRIFESHLRHFKTKYGNAVNIKIIKDELKDIEDFILKANKLSTSETFNNKNISDLHEYSRLLNNYYKNPQKEYYDYYSFFRGNSASVYAKYFLYKQWLQKKNKELEKEVLSNQITKKENPVLDINQRFEKIKKLKTIWLPEPKLTVDDFIQKGIDKAFWNEQLQITIQRKESNFGTGKTLLGNIFIAFKGWAISTHLHYNEAGKIFCEVFNIKIKESTNEKYRCFSSTNNPSQVKAIKTAFNVSKNS